MGYWCVLYVCAHVFIWSYVEPWYKSSRFDEMHIQSFRPVSGLTLMLRTSLRWRAFNCSIYNALLKWRVWNRWFYCSFWLESIFRSKDNRWKAMSMNGNVFPNLPKTFFKKESLILYLVLYGNPMYISFCHNFWDILILKGKTKTLRCYQFNELSLDFTFWLIKMILPWIQCVPLLLLFFFFTNAWDSICILKQIILK